MNELARTVMAFAEVKAGRLPDVSWEALGAAMQAAADGRVIAAIAAGDASAFESGIVTAEETVPLRAH